MYSFIESTLKSSFKEVLVVSLPPISVGFRGASPHVHVFSHMCDMCMPVSHFSKETIFVE